MVLQIRFAIWLTLQIEVEALHICKPSHHFASTISAFHVGLRPPRLPNPARFLYTRPPSLPRAPALQLPRVPAVPPAAVRAVPPAATSGRRTRPRRGNRGGPSFAGTFPRRRTEVDGAELTRTTTATNDERGLGWVATGAKT